MSDLSENWIHNAFGFALDRIMSGEPHRHHSSCIHNLSREEQLDLRRRSHDGSEWTDEEMTLLGLDRDIVVITPDDWEIEAPDLGPSIEEVST